MKDDRPKDELKDIDQTLTLMEQLDGNILGNPIHDPFNINPNKDNTEEEKKNRKKRNRWF